MRRARRILILLLALALVAGVTLFERLWVRGWARPLVVTIYPIAMDETSVEFVGRLKDGDFQEIGASLAREAPRWRRQAIPAPHVVLKAPARVAPPDLLP